MGACITLGLGWNCFVAVAERADKDLIRPSGTFPVSGEGLREIASPWDWVGNCFVTVVPGPVLLAFPTHGEGARRADEVFVFVLWRESFREVVLCVIIGRK